MAMMSERVDEMTSPPIIGRYYLVPCVYVDHKIAEGRGRWLGPQQERVTEPYRQIQTGWWPVIGPRHEDAGLGFHPYHWHYDMRFLAAWQMQERTRNGNDLVRIFGQPLSDYGGLIGPEYRRRKCARKMAVTNRLETLRDALLPHYQEATLKGPCMVCPHRGIPLASLPTIDGVVTCPGHGLKFYAATGRLIRGETPAR